MAKTRFRSDGGLTARMGVVVLLLVALYLAVGAALIVYIDSILIGAVVVAALAWAQWYFSDKLALPRCAPASSHPSRPPSCTA
jgi:heat shock protein HtpX